MQSNPNNDGSLLFHLSNNTEGSALGDVPGVCVSIFCGNQTSLKNTNNLPRPCRFSGSSCGDPCGHSVIRDDPLGSIAFGMNLCFEPPDTMVIVLGDWYYDHSLIEDESPSQHGLLTKTRTRQYLPIPGLEPGQYAIPSRRPTNKVSMHYWRKQKSPSLGIELPTP